LRAGISVLAQNAGGGLVESRRRHLSLCKLLRAKSDGKLVYLCSGMFCAVRKSATGALRIYLNTQSGSMAAAKRVAQFMGVSMPDDRSVAEFSAPKVKALVRRVLRRAGTDPAGVPTPKKSGDVLY
jgi:hypothetical protein